MSRLRRCVLRLLSMFRSTAAEAELAREINAHLHLLEDRFVAEGWSRNEARFAARRAFGGQVEQVKERQRDARGFRWMSEWWLDLKLGTRMLVKYPGLTVIAVFALSMAIGGGAAYLEFVNDLLPPTLPFEDGDRIVRIQNLDQVTGEAEPRALHDFQVWKEDLTSVERIGLSVPFERNLMIGDGRVEPVRGVQISATAFRIIPTAPILGRPLIAEDELLAAPDVAVVGYSLWQSRFDGDPGLVGRTIQLGAVTHTVVGVMPEGFGFPVNQSLWIPFRAAAAGVRRGEGPGLRIFGRLKAGVRIEAAQAELNTIALRLAASSPDSGQRLQPQISPYLAPQRTGEDRLQALVLYAANLFFLALLGVCGANVATLVFARTATREGEITVRTALGASRTRIVVQLFAEALVLSSIAAAVGLLLAKYGSQWGTEAFRTGAGDGQPVPFWWNDRLSVETWVYAGVLALIAAVLVGVVPALKATGPQMQARLSQAGARGSSLKFGGVWTAVIVAQIAFTVLFLMIGVVIQSEVSASRAEMRDVEFRRAEYLSVQIDVPRDASPVTRGDAAPERDLRLTATYQELKRRLSSEPGVDRITYASTFPGRGIAEFRLELQGIDAPVMLDGPLRVRTAVVAADFFETFNAPILTGRAFTESDVELDRPIAIVDQSFVQYVLGDRNPIGQYVRETGVTGSQAGPWCEIVGVIADLNHTLPKNAYNSMLYRPVTPARAEPMRVFVHVAGDASAFAPRLRSIAAAVDPTARLSDFRRLDKVDESDEFAMAFFMRLVAIVSAVALILATAGVYALMSFTVTRRAREIGIRIAMGADARRVLTGIFSRAFAQVGLGIAIGCAPGAALLAFASSQRFGFSGSVVAVLATIAIAAFILGVTMVACFVPARRALSIHPTDALRADA